MNILVINGGPRENSNSRGVAKYARELFENRVANVNYFDVRNNLLPVYLGDEEQNQHQEVNKLRRYAQEADGFFICTPEYHNGMSGALKNAFDFLGKTHFNGKPVVITATAGGGKGGINALNNLRLVLRGVFAIVLPQQVVFDLYMFNEEGALLHEDGKNQVSQLVDNLIFVTNLFVSNNRKEMGKC
ncbi:NADPH-dependent FMN reductase [Effusibacillus pohliae]|uniref:NADPH-dependent FMN reductase n=1 Tax=Effusibacillus pohliae TaxID=232270 RepID=UPI000376DD2C|nr:NAD(P)H-dependent oxidoreductase [Effusibacillus pohliae]